MNNKILDVVAIGSCYVDTNAENYPFPSDGIPAGSELVGGRYDIALGGSAVNFCRLLSSLGLKTTFIGMAGEDPTGGLLSSLLNHHNIEAELIRRPDLQTNIGFNMTSPKGEHIMLVAGTANAALSPEDVLPKLELILPRAKTLYLGGCFKLKAFQNAFIDIAELAEDYSVNLVVDHGRIRASATAEMRDAIKNLALRAKYYFPSRDEFCQLWEVATIEEGLRSLNQQAPNLVVVVKDSGNGAYYYSGNKLQHVDAVVVENVRNATGAGDSFNAGLIAALKDGRPIATAIGYACKVAAAHIQAEATPSLV